MAQHDATSKQAADNFLPYKVPSAAAKFGINLNGILKLLSACVHVCVCVCVPVCMCACVYV